MLTELKKATGARNSYAYGAAGREQDTVKNQQYFTDGRGSVSELTGKSGQLLNTLRYTPFGKITEGGSEEDRIFGYNAEQFTPQSELIYLRARHYSPDMGTFTTQDTYIGRWASPISQNRYTYGMSDPVSHIDPSGHVAVYTYGSFIQIPLPASKPPARPTASKPRAVSSVPGGGSIYDPLAELLAARAAFEALKAQMKSRYVGAISPQVQYKTPTQFMSYFNESQKTVQQAYVLYAPYAVNSSNKATGTVNAYKTATATLVYNPITARNQAVAAASVIYAKGTQIGQMGNSGWVVVNGKTIYYAVHLHVEVFKKTTGKNENPADFFGLI